MLSGNDVSYDARSRVYRLIIENCDFLKVREPLRTEDKVIALTGMSFEEKTEKVMDILVNGMSRSNIEFVTLVDADNLKVVKDIVYKTRNLIPDLVSLNEFKNELFFDWPTFTFEVTGCFLTGYEEIGILENKIGVVSLAFDHAVFIRKPEKE